MMIVLKRGAFSAQTSCDKSAVYQKRGMKKSEGNRFTVEVINPLPPQPNLQNKFSASR
jgi:hypothetical protein